MLGKFVYFFVVLWHGGSCKEMCGTTLWVDKQDDSKTLQSFNSMHWWPSFQRRRIEIRGRIVKSMLSDCVEMLILGTCWKTWYSMVSEQNCTTDHKNGPKLVTNDFLVWSLTYIIHVILNCCHVANCQTMQIGTVSRLPFCRRSWGFKIYIRWNIVHLVKPYVCSN